MCPDETTAGRGTARATSLTHSAGDGGSWPELACPQHVGTELWHARRTSGPGSHRPGLAACIPCLHPQRTGTRRHPGWCSWMWRELIEHWPEAALISAEAVGGGCPSAAVASPHRGGDARRASRHCSPCCRPHSHQESGSICITVRLGPAAAADRSDRQG